MNNSFNYVDCCFDTMCQIFKEFKDNPDVNPSIYERNYIICFSKNFKCHNNKVLVNGELLKNVKDFLVCISQEQIPEHRNEKEVKRKKYFQPDFLIHHNNVSSDISEEKQLLVLEAKTTKRLRKKDFYWDFFKLNVYLRYLRFQNAVYLIINTKKDKIKQLIEEYVEKGYFLMDKGINNDQCLYFFIQEDNGSVIQEGDNDSGPTMYEFNFSTKKLTFIR